MELSVIVDRVGAIRRRFRIDSLMPQLAACEEMLGDAAWWTWPCSGSSRREELVPQRADRRRRRPVDVLPSTRRGHPDRFGRGTGFRPLHRGEPFEVPLARLAEFVTERGNLERKTGGRRGRGAPGPRFVRGIRFVDTPGLGSVFAHNTRVSKEWMPRVGAALVAVSVNHPFPKTTSCSSTTCRCTLPRRSSC